MTREDKELLFKDLCGRLPYGVMVRDDIGRTYKLNIGNAYLADLCYSNGGYVETPIKPYLRPLSSMTEEEKKQFDNFICLDEDAWTGKGIKGYINQSIIMSNGIDWLNKNMFDFRGLIPKGSAIEVTKDNNPYKD